MRYKLFTFNLINIEWNAWNGLIIDVCHIEDSHRLDNSLLGINVSKTFLYVDVLFFQVKVFDKTDLIKKGN